MANPKCPDCGLFFCVCRGDVMGAIGTIGTIGTLGRFESTENRSPTWSPLDSCRWVAEQSRKEVERLKIQRQEHVNKIDWTDKSILAEQKKLAEWERAVSVLEREFPVEYIEPVGPMPSPYLKAKEEMLAAALRNQLVAPDSKNLSWLGGYMTPNVVKAEKDFVVSFKCGCRARFLGGDRENPVASKCTMENGCYFDRDAVISAWEQRDSKYHCLVTDDSSKEPTWGWENAKP